MSAAATAAGYLYASGRLRGRKDDEENKDAPRRRPVRVAALPPREPGEPQAADAPQPPPRARPAPKIQYRTRRWRPDAP